MFAGAFKHQQSIGPAEVIVPWISDVSMFAALECDHSAVPAAALPEQTYPGCGHVGIATGVRSNADLIASLAKSENKFNHSISMRRRLPLRVPSRTIDCDPHAWRNTDIRQQFRDLTACPNLARIVHHTRSNRQCRNGPWNRQIRLTFLHATAKTCNRKINLTRAAAATENGKFIATKASHQIVRTECTPQRSMPISEGRVRMEVHVISADQMVEDTVFVKSRLLREAQRLQIRF